jgi:hypothetical protein
MNGSLFGIMILRSVSLLASLQGQPKLAQSLNVIADAADAGQDVDDHLKAVAEALAAGKEPDFDDIRTRIEAESARLQGP